jgi:hypothetical protein
VESSELEKSTWADSKVGFSLFFLIRDSFSECYMI